MPDRELLPASMKDAPVEQQVWHLSKMLERELGSVHAHLQSVETLLEGNGKPGFKSVLEYQMALREAGAIENVRWAGDFRRNLNAMLWKVVGGTIGGGSVVMYVVIRLREAGLI